MISNQKKLLSSYTETALNGDFSPKSAIISKNTNTKKKIFLILSNYIIRDDLSQKTISRYCPFKKVIRKKQRILSIFTYLHFLKVFCENFFSASFLNQLEISIKHCVFIPILNVFALNIVWVILALAKKHTFSNIVQKVKLIFCQDSHSPFESYRKYKIYKI